MVRARNRETHRYKRQGQPGLSRRACLPAARARRQRQEKQPSANSSNNACNQMQPASDKLSAKRQTLQLKQQRGDNKQAAKLAPANQNSVETGRICLRSTANNQHRTVMTKRRASSPVMIQSVRHMAASPGAVSKQRSTAN